MVEHYDSHHDSADFHDSSEYSSHCWYSHWNSRRMSDDDDMVDEYDGGGDSLYSMYSLLLYSC